jgi:hypothetical protein
MDMNKIQNKNTDKGPMTVDELIMDSDDESALCDMHNWNVDEKEYDEEEEEDIYADMPELIPIEAEAFVVEELDTLDLSQGVFY